MAKSVLMIVTSNAKMGDSDKVTGIWAEELVVPYYAFLDADVQVSLASPKGGPVPFDPGSLKPAGQNEPIIERFLADAAAQKIVANTYIVGDMNALEFDAIFFPGGHGTMWDLPLDDAVSYCVETAFADGKIIAAVCHGPAGLMSAKRTDGHSILFGKRVNAFSNEEEEAVGLTQVVPFLLENRILELGGRYTKGPIWQPYVVQDGNLITGQNPASSQLVAEKVLSALAKLD